MWSCYSSKIRQLTVVLEISVIVAVNESVDVKEKSSVFVVLDVTVAVNDSVVVTDRSSVVVLVRVTSLVVSTLKL
jgi:hypothetical protein